MSAETEEILDIFRAMLEGPTGDGKAKRDAGTKLHWTLDRTHYSAGRRHIRRYNEGEDTDPDSGCHPLVHAAWRFLALAYQELADEGRAPTAETRQGSFDWEAEGNRQLATGVLADAETGSWGQPRGPVRTGHAAAIADEERVPLAYCDPQIDEYGYVNVNAGGGLSHSTVVKPTLYDEVVSRPTHFHTGEEMTTEEVLALVRHGEQRLGIARPMTVIGDEPLDRFDVV